MLVSLYLVEGKIKTAIQRKESLLSLKKNHGLNKF